MSAAAIVVGAVGGSVACTWIGQRPSSTSTDAARRYARSSQVFTPAHARARDAVRDFFGLRPAPVQPIRFPHDTHLTQGMDCTECHLSVAKGPIAGLPTVTLCMGCHDSVATESPEIQKVADYDNRGVDLPWQRVYGYSRTAHVRFNHAPHIRASVECSTCHGNLAEQTVAERVVDLNMGFCITCHEQRKASNDCLTCHY
jgi:hypothetical protein